MTKMRYRAMFYNAGRANQQNSGNHTWRPIGGEIYADSPEDALRDAAANALSPTNARWLILCETEHTYWEFEVKSRTELDITKHEHVLAEHVEAQPA